MASIAYRRSRVKKQKLGTIVPMSPQSLARPAWQLRKQTPQPGLLTILLSIIVLWLFNRPLTPYFPNPQPPTRAQNPLWPRSHSLYLAALDWSLAHGYHAVRWEVVGC